MARNKKGPLHRGPVLQPGGQQVPPSDTQSVPHPSSTFTQPAIPDADQPEADEPPVKKGPKKYVCHICGVVKPRKPDLTGHL